MVFLLIHKIDKVRIAKKRLTVVGIEKNTQDDAAKKQKKHDAIEYFFTGKFHADLLIFYTSVTWKIYI